MKPIGIVAYNKDQFFDFVAANPKLATDIELLSNRAGFKTDTSFKTTLVFIYAKQDYENLRNAICSWEFKDVIYLTSVTSEQRELLETRIR